MIPIQVGCCNSQDAIYCAHYFMSQAMAKDDTYSTIFWQNKSEVYYRTMWRLLSEIIGVDE